MAGIIQSDSAKSLDMVEQSKMSCAETRRENMSRIISELC